MIVDEQSRNDLYVGLQEVLGADRARILMAYLSPFPWSDLATKQDLVALRGDFEAHRVATKQDLETLRVATEKDTRSVAADLHRSISDEIHREGWKIMLAFLATFIALGAIFATMFAAVA